MGDLNFLNVFFDADNFLLKSDMKDFPFSSKENAELEEEPAEWFTDDTINQMLPLLDKFFSNCDETIGNTAVDEHSFDDKFVQKQCSITPEKSASNEELIIDAKLTEHVVPANASDQSICRLQKENILNCDSNFSTSDETFFDAVEYVQEEVIEFEEITVSSSPYSDESVPLSDDSFDADEYDHFIKNRITFDSASEKMKIVYPKYPSRCQESMTSSPSKRIKLTEKLENKNKRRNDEKLSEENSSHPRLQLTSEEKRVALTEGIDLPSHYPLTKEQQRQLKRIRRKIRNKISAQHSRRRKQEYVDSLEQQLKHDAKEKVRLMDRLKILENEKSNLAAKVSKLKAALARCSGQMAQPTSCLLVLIMSLALILAPSMKNSSLLDESVDEKDLFLFDGQSSLLLNSGRSNSRNLLFSHNNSESHGDAKEEYKVITDLLKKIRFPNSNVLSEYLDLLRIRTNEKDSLQKNRTSFKARKHENFEIVENDPQTPSKILKTYELFSSDYNDSKNETVDMKTQKPVTVNWHVG